MQTLGTTSSIGKSGRRSARSRTSVCLSGGELEGGKLAGRSVGRVGALTRSRARSDRQTQARETIEEWAACGVRKKAGRQAGRQDENLNFKAQGGWVYSPLPCCRLDYMMFSFIRRYAAVLRRYE